MAIRAPDGANNNNDDHDYRRVPGVEMACGDAQV